MLFNKVILYGLFELFFWLKEIELLHKKSHYRPNFFAWLLLLSSWGNKITTQWVPIYSNKKTLGEVLWKTFILVKIGLYMTIPKYGPYYMGTSRQIELANASKWVKSYLHDSLPWNFAELLGVTEELKS